MPSAPCLTRRSPAAALPLSPRSMGRAPEPGALSRQTGVACARQPSSPKPGLSGSEFRVFHRLAFPAKQYLATLERVGRVAPCAPFVVKQNSQVCKWWPSAKTGGQDSQFADVPMLSLTAIAAGGRLFRVSTQKIRFAMAANGFQCILMASRACAPGSIARRARCFSRKASFFLCVIGAGFGIYCRT